MGAMASQITSLLSVYSTYYSGADQRKHQSSPVTGEFPAQMASNTENVSIWWRHHTTTAYQHIIKGTINFLPLTHWGPDKMTAIFQTTFLNSCLIIIHKFRLKFLWSLFPRIQLTIFQHWPAPIHYLNQNWLFYVRMYASLGLNELITSKPKLSTTRKKRMSIYKQIDADQSAHNSTKIKCFLIF